MDITFTKAVAEMPVEHEEDFFMPEKSVLDIILPRLVFLILKVMGVVLAIGLLVSSPAFLVPVLMLGVALLTYHTMKKEKAEK